MSEQHVISDKNMSKTKEIERLLLLLQELSDDEIAALNAKRLQMTVKDTTLPSVSLDNELCVIINKSVDVLPSQSDELITKSFDAIPSQSGEQKLTSNKKMLLSVKELAKQFETQVNVKESPQGYISDQQNSTSASKFDFNSKQEHITTLHNIKIQDRQVANNRAAFKEIQRLKNSPPTYINDPPITHENDQSIEVSDDNIRSAYTESSNHRGPSQFLPFGSNSKEVTTTIISPGRHNENLFTKTENQESPEEKDYLSSFQSSPPSHKNNFSATQQTLEGKYSHFAYQNSQPSDNSNLTSVTQQPLDGNDCHFGSQMSQSSHNKYSKLAAKQLPVDNEYRLEFQMSTPTQNEKLWTKPKPQQTLYSKNSHLGPQMSQPRYNKNSALATQQPLDGNNCHCGSQVSQFSHNNNITPATQHSLDCKYSLFRYQMLPPTPNRKFCAIPETQQPPNVKDLRNGVHTPSPSCNIKPSIMAKSRLTLDRKNNHFEYPNTPTTHNENSCTITQSQHQLDVSDSSFQYQVPPLSQYLNTPIIQQPIDEEDYNFEQNSTECIISYIKKPKTPNPIHRKFCPTPETQQPPNVKDLRNGVHTPSPSCNIKPSIMAKSRLTLDRKNNHFEYLNSHNENSCTITQSQHQLDVSDSSFQYQVPPPSQYLNTPIIQQPIDEEDYNFEQNSTECKVSNIKKPKTPNPIHKKFCPTPETQQPPNVKDLRNGVHTPSPSCNIKPSIMAKSRLTLDRKKNHFEFPNTPTTHNENSCAITQSQHQLDVSDSSFQYQVPPPSQYLNTPIIQQPIDEEDYYFEQNSTECKVSNIKKPKTPNPIHKKLEFIFQNKKPWSYDFAPGKITQEINPESSGDESDDELGRFVTNTPRLRATFADPTSTTMISSTLKRNLTLKKPVFDENMLMKQLANTTQELIDTERSYVETMLSDIEHFELMFLRRDCPSQMHSKKEHLFGPIKEIAILHRDKLLPILPENPYDLTIFFEEFLKLITNNSMYLYVLYSINKRRSQKVTDNFKPYLEYYQNLSGKKLGIQSLLLQPIQRLMKYPLLLKEILKNFYSTLPFMKSSSTQIKPCILLMNAIDNLISVANEANEINDIFEWEELNIYGNHNKFQKVLDLYINDLHEDDAGYPGKLFIFEKSIICTEKIEGGFTYRDYFNTSKKIDIIATKHSFRMAQRGRNVLEFHPIHRHTLELSLKYLQNIIDTCPINKADPVDRDSGLGLDR